MGYPHHDELGFHDVTVERMISKRKKKRGVSEFTGARHGKKMKMKGQVSQKRLRPESMASMASMASNFPFG